jgi:hypothetical protein
MAIDHRKVREVMRTRLLEAVPNLPPAARRAWENRKFKPPSPESKLPWIREHYIVVDERQVATNMLGTSAIVQYDVVAPTGKGTEAVDDLTKEIREAFKPGVGLQGKGIEIAIDRSEGSSPIVDEIWYFVPVRINIRTYVENIVT